MGAFQHESIVRLYEGFNSFGIGSLTRKVPFSVDPYRMPGCDEKLPNLNHLNEVEDIALEHTSHNASSINFISSFEFTDFLLCTIFHFDRAIEVDASSPFIVIILHVNWCGLID